MTEIHDLKPCPFCGAELRPPNSVEYPKMGLARLHPGDLDDRSCPIAGWGFYDEQLITWNTRAEDAVLKQRIAELKAENERLRDYGDRWDFEIHHDRIEAADHIEKLEADNARQREALREVARLLSYASQDAVNEATAQTNKNMAWRKACAALQGKSHDA